MILYLLKTDLYWDFGADFSCILLVFSIMSRQECKISCRQSVLPLAKKAAFPRRISAPRIKRTHRPQALAEPVRKRLHPSFRVTHRIFCRKGRRYIQRKIPPKSSFPLLPQARTSVLRSIGENAYFNTVLVLFYGKFHHIRYVFAAA